MQASLNARAFRFPSTAMDDLDELRIPQQPTARELRRARLLRYLARRRLSFLALHLGLGVAGWAVIGMAAWGIVSLLD